MLFGGLAAPAMATQQPDSARGTVKIEETELTDAENPNEVKVGCDFSIEFFGMDAGSVPVTFTLMPPSGEGVVAERTAQVQAAQGQELSGALDVDLTRDLSAVPPAQAEDFDYKVRVDAVVKSTSGNATITKSAMLFIVCEPKVAATGGASGAGGAGGAGGGGDEATVKGQAAAGNSVPIGGVDAGQGGTASPDSTPLAWAATAGAALLGILLLTLLRRRQGV